MSYIANLIERATNTSLDLENNKIGNYRITPQHGSGLAVYHIYKVGAKPSYSKSTRYRGQESHIATINITHEVRIEIVEDYTTANEKKEIVRILKEIYPSFKVWIDKEEE